MSRRADDKNVQQRDESSGARASMRRGTAIVAVFLAAAYTAMILVADSRDLHAAWDRMEAHFLILPLIATFLSYLTMSFSYEGIVRAAGASISSRDMLRITLVANTANYIFPTGGLSGFAFRLMFFTKRGISAGTAVAISFTQTLLTNLMLILFVVYGMVNLLITGGIGGVSLVAASIATGVLSAGFLLLVLMIWIDEFRRRVVKTGARLVDRILERTRYHGRFAERAQHFFVHVEEGMALCAGRPGAMVIPSLWIFLDWLCMMGALWLGFYATGREISFSLITIAFSISSIAAFISFIPAGAGVLEGALAGTLSGLGVPLGESLLPIVLYRFCYFIVPTIVSFFLAHGAFTGARTPEEIV